MIGILTTTDDGRQTIGKLGLYDPYFCFKCVTLELSWKDNKRNKSCIPTGEYKVTHRYSEKYGEHLLVNNVINRSYILIHAGNFVEDTNGCILVGESLAKIDENNLKDVTNSRETLKELMRWIPDEGIDLKIDRI